MSGPAVVDTQHPLTQTFPALTQKFIVDFANGIDVARDHIRVQRAREGLFARMYDGFTGQAGRRQSEVNARLTDGVEGALRWLTELSQSVTLTNQTLVRVQGRVTELQRNVGHLAQVTVELRERLQMLESRLSEATLRLQQEVARISLEQRAERQMNQVFDKWAAGRLDALPLLPRLSVCLEELYWGDFGALVEPCQDVVLARSLVQQVADRAIRQLREDLRRQSDAEVPERLPTLSWLQRRSTPTADLSEADGLEATGYLGDWALPERQPFTYVVTQRPQDWPLTMPRRLDASRAAQALVVERFPELSA